MPAERKPGRGMDEVMTGLGEAIQRFASVLPEIPSEPAQKTVLASDGRRLSRMLHLLLPEAQKAEALGKHLPVLTKAHERLSILVDTLETESLLGIAEIPAMDDLHIFTHLKEKPLEDVISLFSLVIAEQSTLSGLEKVSLHYALVELGVPAGLGIGVVGWIKLILVIFLVLLLIVSLFKPALLPAVTALAGVLVVIDKVGAAPQQGPGAPVGPGAGPGLPPPPQPPPPPVIHYPDGDVICTQPPIWKPKDGTPVVIGLTPPPPPPPKPLFHVVAVDIPLIGCVWFELNDPGKGGYHLLEYTGTGQNDPSLEIEQDGAVTTVTPPDYRFLPGGKKTRLHLVGDRNVRRDVTITEYSK